MFRHRGLPPADRCGAYGAGMAGRRNTARLGRHAASRMAGRLNPSQRPVRRPHFSALQNPTVYLLKLRSYPASSE